MQVEFGWEKSPSTFAPAFKRESDVKDEMTEFGQFLKFDNLTVVPIDTRPVDKSLLTEEEIVWLNDYNKMCYEKLSPYLSGHDLEYLREQCKEI